MSGPVNAILGNWEVDGIIRATSGFPLFVVDSANGGTGNPGHPELLSLGTETD